MAVTQREHIQDLLCTYLNRKHCFLVRRGTTAIYLALKFIERKKGRGEVILPTMACASLAQIVLYAGFKPVFADITPSGFVIDAGSVQSLITSHTRAILPVHLFGHAAQMDDIIALAMAHELYVIEDAAQALGGSYRGRKLGGLGNFSVLSFGGTKIVSAGGGGAITTDDDDAALMLADELDRLPTTEEDSIARRLKELSHRNLYHAVVDLLRVDPQLQVRDTFMSAISHYQDLYVGRFPADEQMLTHIASGLATLSDTSARRVERAAAYHELLVGEGLVRSHGWQESGVVWRYSLLIQDPGKALQVTEGLRKSGIHVSNHYWSLADLFSNEKIQPHTRYVCPRIVNLWVDDHATPDYIERSCDVLLRHLEMVPK